MNDYNGLARSEWRLEVARVRAAKQKRITLIVVAVLGLLLLLLAWSSLRASGRVSPPSVTVEWPSPQKYGRRIFASGATEKAPAILATLVVRKGQPFTVSVSQPEKWTVRAVSTDTNETGSKVTWAPAQSGKLKLFCRPKVGGWKRLFSWTLPTFEMHIEGIIPTVLADGRLRIPATKVPTSGNTTSRQVWLSSQVVTSGYATEWDERVIPIAQAAPPPVAPPFTSEPRWKLVNGFGPDLAARAAGDTGTYIQSNDRDAMAEVVDTTTRVARFAAEAASRASIKFIVAERAPTKFGAILRLDFDGSGTRFGWVKNPGETAATPLRWWDSQLGTGLGSEALPPAFPRR
jgi:hypothetical protein